MTKRHAFTTDTPDRLILDEGMVYKDYGIVTQELIGATRGGSTFNPGIVLREMPVDGSMGPVYDMTRLESCTPEFVLNMLEMSMANLKRMLPGMQTETTDLTLFSDGEVPVGTPNGTLTTFTVTNTIAVPASVIVYVAGVAKLYTTDFTAATKTITFVTAPATGAAITVDYTYAATVADYTTFRPGEIAAATDHWTNLTWVGTISGKTSPVLIQLFKPLVQGGWNMAFAAMNEASPAVTFRGYWTKTDLDNIDPPFRIVYPTA